jgi:hypothetical protein
VFVRRAGKHYGFAGQTEDDNGCPDPGHGLQSAALEMDSAGPRCHLRGQHRPSTEANR